MSRKPLLFWSVTLSQNYNALPSVDRTKVILAEFSKQWCFQLEKGSKLEKLHYQCRMILEEPQMLATMLHCFECRGFNVHDVTFLPESNKSIEQGGLSFYVMKDDTRVDGPWCDPTYKPPKPPDWIPEMCQTIRDHPRPWMSSLLTKLAGPAHHRKIIWICTLHGLGGVGKSLFTTYLEAANIACYLGDGTPIQLKEGTIAEGEWPAYTLDLPKTFAHDNRLGDYINTLETIKNGFIKTAMHGKRKKLMMERRPHVIGFANIHPPFGMMTEGRFEVYTVDPNLEPHEQTLDPWTPQDTQERL